MNTEWHSKDLPLFISLTARHQKVLSSWTSRFLELTYPMGKRPGKSSFNKIIDKMGEK